MKVWQNTTAKQNKAPGRISAALVLLLGMLFVMIACSSVPSQEEDVPDAVRVNLILDPAPGIFEKSPLVTVLADADITIRYTIDGTIPTMASPIFPEEGLAADSESCVNVDGSRVLILRCAGFDEDGVCVTETISGSYIVTANGTSRYTTPVVSIITDPDSLYGYENGIMVEGKLYDDALANGNPEGFSPELINANYLQSGMDWERAVYIELFDRDAAGNSTAVIGQNAGLRIFGNLSRRQKQKSFRIIARRSYSPGSGKFEYPVFGRSESLAGYPVYEYNSLILRSGANSMFSNMLANPALMRLAQQTDLDYQEVTPAVLYLNGEYYGLVHLTENHDTAYVESHYGIPAEQVEFVEAELDYGYNIYWKLDAGAESALSDFTALLDFICTADMSAAENYDTVCAQMDVDNYISYMLFEAYIDNLDWPHNNVKVWRTSPAAADEKNLWADGKWRFMLKDIERSFGSENKRGRDIFDVLFKDAELDLTNAFRSLWENDTFRQKVLLRLCDLLGTVFVPENICEVISEYQLSMSKEIGHVIERWDFVPYEFVWYDYVDDLRDFAARRYRDVWNSISAQFPEAAFAATSVTAVKGGTLTVNTAEVSEETSTAFSYPVGAEIKISANAEEGYLFVGFEITGEIRKVSEDGTSACFVLDGDGEIRAVFEKTTPAVLCINEVKYQHKKTDVSEDFAELYNASDEAMTLDGWYITDDAERPDKFSLAGMTVAARGFLTLEMNGNINKAGEYAEGVLSCPIKLSGGETLLLYREENGVFICVDSLELTEFIDDALHYGRYPDGGNMKILSEDERTPGQKNRLVTERALPDVLMRVFVRRGEFCDVEKIDGVDFIHISDAVRLYPEKENPDFAEILAAAADADGWISIVRLHDLLSDAYPIYFVETYGSYVGQ